MKGRFYSFFYDKRFSDLLIVFKVGKIMKIYNLLKAILKPFLIMQNILIKNNIFVYIKRRISLLFKSVCILFNGTNFGTVFYSIQMYIIRFLVNI